MTDNTLVKTCLIIGDPVSHSLSPAMHNAAYKALGIDSEYIFIAKQIKPEELDHAMQKDLRAPGIRAFACTIPHKETIIPYLDSIDDTAKEIGAVNTVINTKGLLKGYNTDWQGALNALLRFTTLQNKNVAILGSGGTTRAIVYGLHKEGCNITMYCRNTEKAFSSFQDFTHKIYSWDKREETSKADIIINTTPIGREDDSSPISGEGIHEQHVVFDVNYKKGSTQLLNFAKSKKAITVDGLEMLLQQGMLQFELYTGLKAPEDDMRKALNR